MRPLFLLISGKRKSGKDYCASRLVAILKEAGLSTQCQGVSHHLKKIYAQQNTGIDFEELLTDSPYKEKYRKDMIVWGESVRTKDPGFFCRLVEEEARNGCSDVFIIPDCRRPTDLQHFEDDTKYNKLLIRIVAEEEVRKLRGWQFAEGIDDAESECALDSWDKFDYVVGNSGTDVEKQLQEVKELVLGRI